MLVKCGTLYFYITCLYLQAEYKKAVSTNQWHRRLEFPSGETIVMHNPKVNICLIGGLVMINLISLI